MATCDHDHYHDMTEILSLPPNSIILIKGDIGDDYGEFILTLSETLHAQSRDDVLIIHLGDGMTLDGRESRSL